MGIKDIILTTSHKPVHLHGLVIQMVYQKLLKINLYAFLQIKVSYLLPDIFPTRILRCLHFN
jgi:hypothetical protein